MKAAPRRTLMTHQWHALRYAKQFSARSDRGVALFLEMRLGKTLVAIRWAKRLDGPKLVIAPLSVLHSWKEELQLEGIRSVILVGTREQRNGAAMIGLQQGRQWFLVNYEGLFHPANSRKNVRAQPSGIAKHLWPTVILDESALIRNPMAMRSKVCCDYLGQAEHRACLSGLPNPESPMDFFQQMKFLNHSFMGFDNFWVFRQTMFQPDKFGHRWFPKRNTLKAIRKSVQTSAFIRSRKEVGLGNVHIHEKRFVFLPKKVREAYDSMRKKFTAGDVSTKYVVTRYNYLRQLASGLPKDAALPSHSEKLHELMLLLGGELKGQSVVVWYCYKREGKEITAAIRAKNIPVARIDAKVPLVKRKNYRHTLRKGSLRVLVMQVKCGQYGLDLSAASTAVYFSLPPSHDMYAQSKDRIEHPKKKEPLLSVSLLAKDTVDEDICEALQHKRWSSQSMLGKLIDKLRKGKANE